MIIEHETTTRNGEPAIRVRLDYDEAREYLALDEKWIDLLDSLTEGERDEVTIELYLVPLREVAEYAVGTAGEVTGRLPSLTAATTTWTEDDYDEALCTLEGISRSEYLEVLDRAARIIAREVRAWDTEHISELVGLLTRLDAIGDRADRRVGAEDYVRMDALPSAPIPEGVDTSYLVWAMSTTGGMLTGESADCVETILDVIQAQNPDLDECDLVQRADLPKPVRTWYTEDNSISPDDARYVWVTGDEEPKIRWGDVLREYGFRVWGISP